MISMIYGKCENKFIAHSNLIKKLKQQFSLASRLHVAASYIVKI